MHGVSHDLLALRRNLGAVLDGLRVLLAVLLRFLGDLPVAPAIEALDYAGESFLWLRTLISKVSSIHL